MRANYLRQIFKHQQLLRASKSPHLVGCAKHDRITPCLTSVSASLYNPSIRFQVLPSQLRPDYYKAAFREAMEVLTSLNTVVLPCFLLLTHMAFASQDTDASAKYSAGIVRTSSARLAATTLLAEVAQQTASAAKDASPPKPQIEFAPDSYVGAVVGVMFLAGIVMLLIKWPRRRPRQNVYGFPRAPKRTRRAS